MTDTKWLTVDEAAFLSKEMGLNRTKKTIRSWARNGHVTSNKQTTATGSMWVLERDDLVAKINAELEFSNQLTEVRESSYWTEPVRTGSDQYEPVQTRSNPSEPVHTSRDSAPPEPQESHELSSLRTQIHALNVDVAWRDKMLDKLTRENEALQQNLHGQARYIGHLESDLMRLGGEPDTRFLAAPTAQTQSPIERSEILVGDRPHPDQASFTSG